MTSQHGIGGLRVDVPALEPDAVLLAQLVELSSAATPSAKSSRASSMKALFASAGVVVVATTTCWVAGAVPGTPSPLHPAHHPHPEVSPSPSPSKAPVERTPGAYDPTSQAPGSIHPTPNGRRHSAAPGTSPTARPGGTRTHGPHTGRSDESGHGHHPPGHSGHVPHPGYGVGHAPGQESRGRGARTDGAGHGGGHDGGSVIAGQGVQDGTSQDGTSQGGASQDDATQGSPSGRLPAILFHPDHLLSGLVGDGRVTTQQHPRLDPGRGEGTEAGSP